MDTFLHDLRYAARRLFASPGFTLTAALTLALGIGATSTIFSVVNAVLLRPPAAVREPERLVALYTSDYSGPLYGTSSYADYVDFAAQSANVLEGVAAYAPRPFSLSTGRETVRAFGEVVTGNYFQLLGVPAQLGRTLLPADDAGAAAPVVVIGDGLWRRAFGADPAVLGRVVRIGSTSYTVVGVAARGFEGSMRGMAQEMWVPISSPRGMPDDLTRRGDRGLFLIARMRYGFTPALLRTHMAVVARRLHQAFPEQWTDVHRQSRVITALPEAQARVLPQIRGMVLTFMGLLMTVVGLVLLICCANVANLLLARATSRRREIAVRLSLGATRGRLVRQLLTESTALALLGGIGGALIATWTTAFLQGFVADTLAGRFEVPVSLDLSVDRSVLLFAGAVATLTGVLFGLAPALRATRPDLVPALKDEPAVMGRRRRLSLRNALVVAQVAVSLVLLVTAGLFVRSLRNAQSARPGFAVEGVAMLSAELSVQGYRAERAVAFWDRLSERARALPGVRAAALAEEVPLGLSGTRRGIQVEGYQRRPGEDMEFGSNVVGPDYFRAMEIALVRGREFAPADREGAAPVVVVNESFARRIWPGQDPLGKRFSAGGLEGMSVIGVARDAKYNSLGEEPKPFFYMPYLQSPSSDMTLTVRTTGDATALLPVLRREAKALDPDLPVQALTMEEHLGVSLLPSRILAALLAVFGVCGLGLASIGLYGVIAYAVSQRTKEIGIRIALGASAADVRSMVVRQGLALTAVGGAVGLAVALAATRLAQSLLFGVDAADPLTYAGISIVLAGTAWLASYLPARRATRLDPLAALRSE